MEVQPDFLPAFGDHPGDAAQCLQAERVREQRVDEVRRLETACREHAQLIGKSPGVGAMPSVEVQVQLARAVVIGGERRVRPPWRFRPDFGIDGEEDLDHELIARTAAWAQRRMISHATIAARPRTACRGPLAPARITCRTC